MQRDLLLLAEMIAAAERAQTLVAGVEVAALEVDHTRREALPWNFTVLGEAAAQLGEDLRARFSFVKWARPGQLRNRIVHGYWSIDMEILYATARDDLPEFTQ